VAAALQQRLLPGDRALLLYEGGVDSTSLLSPELMVETLRRFGFDVRVVPYAAWRRKVLALASTADTRNALFPFTDVIYALTPLRFLGQRYQLEWWLENRGCPDEIRAALEPREHIQPAVVSQMVGYYVQAGAMPSPSSAGRSSPYTSPWRCRRTCRSPW
jgi:hypothetical protein